MVELVVWEELQPMWDPSHIHISLQVEQSIPERLHSVVQTHIRAVLEEVQSAGTPHWIIQGRMASHGKDPMMEQGKRVKVKEWQR